MKLNQDCIRDILIYLEENLSYNDNFLATDIDIDKYTVEDILYTISLLNEAGYINATAVNGFAYNNFFIKSLTMSGHELLNNIRDNSVWKKTKEATSKFASVSLKLLSSVASSVLTNMINESFQM